MSLQASCFNLYLPANVALCTSDSYLILFGSGDPWQVVIVPNWSMMS